MRLTYEKPLRYGDYFIYDSPAWGCEVVLVSNKYAHRWGWGDKYHFVHTDYDGAPDAKDNRLGNAETIEECIELIDELEN